MAYAYRADVGAPVSGTSDRVAVDIDKLTKNQLTDIFACTLREIDGQTVTPVIPQLGSGTRSSWLTALGLSETTLVTVDETVTSAGVTRGGCVEVGQEHDGKSMKVRNAIMPMSVSRWVAMAQGLTVNKIGSAILAGSSLVSNGGSPQAPVTGTGTSMIPNPLYYADITWGRETWLVTDYDRVTLGRPGYDAALARALNKTVANSLANTTTTTPVFSGFWKLKYGILPPSSGTVVRHTEANN
jgi:hypothetical protein